MNLKRLIKIGLSIALQLSCLSAFAQEARHFGLSVNDALGECVRKLYQKPMLRMEGTSPRLKFEACPGRIADFETQMKIDNLRILTLPQWIVVANSHDFPPQQTFRVRQFTWNTLDVRVNAGKLSPETSLTADQMDAIASEIMKNARMPLIAAKDKGNGPENKAYIDLWFHSDLVQLDPKAPPYVVTVVKQDGGGSTGRLVMGRFEKDNYRIMWDSPLFGTNYFSLEYDDLTGDGIEEILLYWMTGGNKQYPLLAAFDVSGHELTRQESKCDDQNSGEWFYSQDGVCPINTAEPDFQFVPSKDGTKDMIAAQGYGHVRFHLIGGKYVPLAHHKGSR